MAGVDPLRPQLAPNHLAADPDLLCDIGKVRPFRRSATITATSLSNSVMRRASCAAASLRRCSIQRGSWRVDGGVNPRKSGDGRKSGTRIAAPDQPLLAIFRSDANGCPVALCQRRQPPKAGAVGQRLQRVAGQSSWTIKNDGWFRIAQVRLTRERPYAKTVPFAKRPHRRLRADSRRRQHGRHRHAVPATVWHVGPRSSGNACGVGSRLTCGTWHGLLRPRCSPAGAGALPSGAVARGRARRARHALRTAVVRERSDPVASEPEALRAWRSGACGARRPAQTAPTRGEAPAPGWRAPGGRTGEPVPWPTSRSRGRAMPRQDAPGTHCQDGTRAARLCRP